MKPPVNLIDYVVGFMCKLFLAWKLTSQNLFKTQGWMKRVFDGHVEAGVFSPSDYRGHITDTCQLEKSYLNCLVNMVSEV